MKLRLECIAFVLSIGMATLSLNAKTLYFIGDDPGELWSNPNNWIFWNGTHWEGGVIPQNGDSLNFEFANQAFEDRVIANNDLTDLTVSSIRFGFDDLDLETYIILGNTLRITGSIDVEHPDTLVEIRCGLILDGVSIRAVAPMGLDHPATLSVTGPIFMEGTAGLSLNTHYAGKIEFAGPISGNGDIRLPSYTPDGGYPAQAVKLSGSGDNTFVGSLIMSANRTLELDKSGTAVPGPLVIGTNSDVSLKRSHQIADTSKVAITSGGRFKLDGNAETIGSLCVTNLSEDTLAAFVLTSGSTLSVTGDVTAHNDAVAVTPSIFGKLGLPPGDHSISVSGNQFYGLNIQAQILGDGGFTKTGTAGLVLAGNNSFNGEAAVTQGVVEARQATALGSVAGFTYLSNNATLILNSAAIYGESLFVRGNLSLGPDASGSWLEAVGTNVWSGPIILDTNLVVTGYGNSRLDLNGLISGAGGLRCLSGTVEISGTDANTFTGTTVVQNPLLLLNKSSGVAAFNGPLVVGGGGAGPKEARWLQDYQRVGANVTIHTNGSVNLNNHSDDFGPITFFGGEIRSGTGELGIYGLVSVNFEQYGTINGRIGLPSGYREFHVEFNPTTSAGLHINAIVGGPGHLRKTGLGRLWLNGINTYTGLTVVDEGRLVVTDSAGLGSANGDTIVNDGGTLQCSPGLSTIIVPERISIRGTGTAGDGALEIYGNTHLRNLFPSIYACLDLTTNATVRVETGTLIVDGFISGAGSLIKTGMGTLVFSNANANTYSGDTMISEGSLELRKPNSIISVPGNLVLGPAATTIGAWWYQSGAMNANATVTVNANSLLDLNGFDQTLFGLTLNDGGDVQTGLGRLNISAGGTVKVGSLSQSGSHRSSSITGNLGLPANNFITFNVAPYAIFPPFANAPELDVLALINVNGFESPSLEPAGFAKVAMGWMRLSANNTYKGEAFVSAGTMQVEGSQPQSSARVGAGGRVQGSGVIGHVNFLGSSGVIAPGASPGVLTTSNFNAGATGNGILQVELYGTTPGSGHDQVNVRGTVTLTGTTLNGLLSFPSALNDQFTIINNDDSDAVIGVFNGLPQNASLYIGEEQFNISYTGGTGNDVVLTRIPTPPRPVLTIEQIPPSQVRLLWPTNDSQFRLECSANLPPTNWTSALPLPVIVGTNYVVTNATSGTMSSSVVTPVAWYRFGENDPGAAPDIAITNATTDSAGVNHLKQFGSPLYSTAVSTDAVTQVASSLGVQLNGSGQYLSNAVVTSVVDNFGIEAWVKPNAVSSTYHFIAYNGDTANNGWGIAWQDGVLQGWFGNVILFGSGVITPGLWAHVALVRDNGLSTLYLNGEPVSNPTIFGPKPPTTGFAIGIRPQTPTSEFFNGAIDEVRVFTFAPGQFTTNDLLLNRISTLTAVPSVKFYRLVKP